MADKEVDSDGPSSYLDDHNLTWGNHRNYPMFTECFQDSVLGTLASIWLLATFPIYMVVLYKTKDRVLERSWLYQAKMGLATVHIALRCNDILSMLNTDSHTGLDLNMARLLAYSTEVIAVLMSTVLVDQERKKNYVTSFVLTMYWFFSSVCGIIVFYCKVMEPASDITSTDLLTYQAVVACSILQLILHSLPEPLFIQEGKKPSPLSRASFFSRLFYLWSNKYLVAGYSRPLNDDDFDDLVDDVQCAHVTSELIQNWEDEKNRLNEGDKKKQVKVSLFRVLFKTYAKQLIGNNSLRCLDLITDYMRPIIVGCLVGFADDLSEPTWKAFVYLFGFLIFNFGASVNFNYIIYQTHCVATKLRSALTNMIVQKSLNMTSRSRAEKTAGDMNNLITEDIEGLRFWVGHFWVVWSVPFEFVLYTILLYSVVGNAVYVAIALMLLAMPLNTYFAKVGHKTHKAKTDQKDERIKLLTEVLNGIKVLKLYAWELAFGDKVLDIREKELKILQKMRFFGILAHLIWGIIPFFMACATLTAYVYLDENHVLTAKTAFTALSIFGALNGTFNAMPHIFSHFIRGYTCMTRLHDFLNMEEIDPDDVTHEESDNAITVEDGQFTWDPKLGACLKDIQMGVPKGGLVAVVGKIGSGKSSLLSAILGDVEKDSGSVNVTGTTAYVPQQAWIQNATLRENILFGDRLRKQAYDDVIEACALTKDLEMFTGGDQTEIGEKGINLSGGQKQRVSLARAVYSNADIYLLDDPLSAVDAHVGKHIFDHVIGSDGLLRNKTRVLVTHGTTWLPFTDKVVVMDGGRIIEQGPYEELMRSDQKFAQFIKEYALHKSESSVSLEDSSEEDSLRSASESGYMSRTSSSESEDDFNCIPEPTSPVCTVDAIDFSSHVPHKSRAQFRRSISKLVSHDNSGIKHKHANKTIEDLSKLDENESNNNTEPAKQSDDSGKLMEEEEIEEGLVKIRHLLTYFRAIGPWYCVIGLIAFVLAKIVETLGSFNVKNWTSDPELTNLTELSSDSEYRQEKNAYYMRMYAYIGFARLFLDIVFRLMLTLRAIHAADMLHRQMLRNVLRGPMSFFDATPVGRITHRFSSDIEPLDGSLEDSWKGLMNCVFDFLKVFIVVSLTLPQFLFILPPIIYAYYYIQDNFVPTKRQISRMRSKRRSPIISHFSETLSGSSVIRAFNKQQQFTTESANKVDSFHEFEFVDLGIERWLSVRLDFLNVACIYGTVLLAVLNRDTLSGPVLGLALGTASLLHGCLHGFVRCFSELQKNLVCLEKIEDYTTKETEAPLHTSIKPPESWPMNGDVEINNFSLRYRKGQDLVLKGINVSIKPGEKVGIVGRTGAGKSSLTIGLFRLVEAAEGRITLDDHDISDLGLYDLRSNLTILPQDPGLFSGTLRMNLDPLGSHSDESIYHALQHAHLKPFVDSLPDKLDYQCGEGGQNLSVGQRQLICLARSLLRKSNILVLDEATANVDMETDELIQTTIKTEFKECTVLTIAHRLNTIIDYDRILVLDKGEVKEFDAPKVLLENTNSEFYSMAKDAGIV